MAGIDRETFIRRYMANSKIADYRIDGERVYFADRYKCALPCRCGEEECEGWAMVPPSGREWHLFQNQLPGAKPTWQDAADADLAYMKSHP